MQIQFLGAARTVTGSMHLLRTGRGSILLDCGLFQGRRRESFERNQHLPVPTGELIAAVLSHAHIDHSGAVPLLVKNGYHGPIYATPATRDLASVMLRDAAAIQAQDARYLNRQAEKNDLEVEPVVPLYDEQDALAAIGQLYSVPYHLPCLLAPDVRLTFLDAGHVLGSAVCVLELEDGGRTRTVVFSGDIGRANMPILADPEIPRGADVLIMESTYGDRLHDDIAAMDARLAEVVQRTAGRGGKVIIPSFALERAQEIVFALKRLQESGQIGPIPVYVDSPLTVKITEVFKLHPECYDAETRAMIVGRRSPFEFPGLHYVGSVDDSKAINGLRGPAIIIAASGMCEAGRVLHHLLNSIEDQRNSVVIVGFQAQHTLGRRLVEKRPRVKIFGVERVRRAEVVVLNGFSAHADQKDLLGFALGCRETGPVGKIALVHGEPKAQAALADLLAQRGLGRPFIPAAGEVMEL
ncbi:MAG: MBL fold metallo-hydrolase [Deltaproteobacteria bacterium]|nr:MBL fold metallo-hydrolase [Deltaproteobacteria bacterium]